MILISSKVWLMGPSGLGHCGARYCLTSRT
uniref:Uncharacterized protein n=1 Tax=Anguilla anguilla TaxID=7936 RepID=A0A0E9UGK5_ANGAN